MIEQIAGMLYLALVVARMIALTVSRTATRSCSTDRSRESRAGVTATRLIPER
jgi:hypothetical protein